MRAGTAADLAGMTTMVVSPGVPLTHPAPHPMIAEATRLSIPLTCDIDLFAAVARERGHEIVAVTGTNGKSTTASLLHHLLQHAGRTALLGGNIGVPVLDLELPEEPATLVLEVSSYQLDLCSAFHPHVALWLNLTPDHLDRHGDLAGYIRAKERIFRHMTGDDLAIIGVEDAPSRELAARLEGRCRVRRVKAEDARVSLAGIASLRGAHNAQNAALATAALEELGLDLATIQAGLETFTGLPHRAEEVARIGRVSFVNDSKATNPVAATKSLASFEHIYWIAGGLPKPGGFGDIEPYLSKVRRAYLIGEAREELAAFLASRVLHTSHASLREALSAAVVDASRDRAGSDHAAEVTILLAPACASFDQFPSYEARGDQFRQLAREIASRQVLGGAA